MNKEKYEQSFIENFDLWNNLLEHTNNLIRTNFGNISMLCSIADDNYKMPDQPEILDYDSFCKYFIIAEQKYKGASKDTKLAEELLIEICSMFFRDYVKKFNIDVKSI
jgi:hypothetical protein